MIKDPSSRRELLSALLLLGAFPAVARAQDDDEAAPPPEEAPWPLIGYRRIVSSGRAVLHVDPGEGRVARVRFQAQQRGLAIDHVRFELVGDAEPIEVRPRQRLRAGHTGDPIELPPDVELRVLRIDVRVMAGRGAVTLNLLGDPAG